MVRRWRCMSHIVRPSQRSGFDRLGWIWHDGTRQGSTHRSTVPYCARLMFGPPGHATASPQALRGPVGLRRPPGGSPAADFHRRPPVWAARSSYRRRPGLLYPYSIFCERVIERGSLDLPPIQAELSLNAACPLSGVRRVFATGQQPAHAGIPLCSLRLCPVWLK